MHPALVRHVVRPLVNQAARRPTSSALRELERTQWLSPDQIQELQWAKVRALLRHAHARVPYYRGLFRALGAEPEDFRFPEDLARFPTLTKEVLRDRGPELIADGAARLASRRTSGSTGIPVRSFMDPRSQIWWLAAERRRRRWWGVDLGAREAELSTRIRSRKLLLLRRHLLNEASFLSVDLSEAGVRGLLREVTRFRAVSLRGTPTKLTHIGQFLLQHPGGDWPRLKVVWTSAEVLYPDQRALIKRAFHCPVVDEYGSSENGLFAVECPHGRMHAMAENHLFEYRPVAPGSDVSEMIITDLNNYGMPFIRYAIGDLGVPVRERCSCGRGLPLLEVRGGRVGDLAVTAHGGYLDSAVFVRILERAAKERIRQFQIVQEAVDRFTVLLVADRPNGLGEEIRTEFRAVLGPRLAVEIRTIEEIPLDPSGKLRRFVSRLDHPAIRHRATPAPPAAAGAR